MRVLITTKRLTVEDSQPGNKHILCEPSFTHAEILRAKTVVEAIKEYLKSTTVCNITNLEATIII